MLHTRVHVSQKNNKTIETKETVIHEKQQNQKKSKKQRTINFFFSFVLFSCLVSFLLFSCVSFLLVLFNNHKKNKHSNSTVQKLSKVKNKETQK